MIDGVAVGHCGAFWTCKSTAVCQSCASFGKKRSLQNLIFGAVKHWPWTPRSGPPQLHWKIDGQTIPNFDPLASCEDLFVWKCLNHLEPTWTSLNLSWNNVCTGEQLGNHFKFVGTDLWTREPIGTYRNQVGTKWNQFVHGRAWRWIFVCFCGLWCFWMLFDPCPRNLILWLYLVGVLLGICEFELKTFYLEKLEERFSSLRTLLK